MDEVALAFGFQKVVADALEVGQLCLEKRAPKAVSMGVFQKRYFAS
jgi:hypothetical protein